MSVTGLFILELAQLVAVIMVSLFVAAVFASALAGVGVLLLLAIAKFFRFLRRKWKRREHNKPEHVDTAEITGCSDKIRA